MQRYTTNCRFESNPAVVPSSIAGRKSNRSIIGAVLVLAITTPLFAMFVRFPEVPVERLIENTSAYIKEHPQDAMGPYTLARIHYLAFATRSPQLRAGGADPNRPLFVDETFRRIPSPSAVASQSVWTESQLREHLSAAVENYQAALKMDPRNGLFHLGLASVAEAALTAGFALGPVPGSAAPPPENQDLLPLWRELAISEYLAAFDLNAQADTAIRTLPIAGLESMVSYEAGQHYLAMVNSRGARRNEADSISRVRSTLRRLSNKPAGPITPIVFSLRSVAPLEDLLDARTTVTFDLDGTSRPQRYTWIRPNTGVLVWAPDVSVKITSGHQLFGSVTFNMFWSDGYRALDALDDNRDGTLADGELEGLAVWFDRNQDGVSQAGEVLSLDNAGIRSLSTRATGRVGSSLMNSKGLTAADGRQLPTYDWTTEPLATASPELLGPTS